jgi:ribonucleoside-diphosphate reductase alpha chain
VTGRQLHPAEHLAMLAALAPLVDGSISKTIPLASATSASEVAQLLAQAWSLGIKGVTVYRDNPVIPPAWGCRRRSP